MRFKHIDTHKKVQKIVNVFTYTNDEKIKIIEILGVIYNWICQTYCEKFNIDEFINVSWIDSDHLCVMIDALYCIHAETA